jgi:hypothetical protein
VVASIGRWSVLDLPAQYRVNAIHAALLPTGKVLIVAGSGNIPVNFVAGSFKTLLWTFIQTSFGSSQRRMTYSAPATRCCPTANC